MSTFYLDYELGNDATTATPLGWWSVAYTNGNGTQPPSDNQATGATSGQTAKVTVVTVSSGTWAGGNAAGTIYWYGMSGAFVAETLTFANGATCSIGGAFTYCAWKTFGSGATAARIAPGDTIRIKKSTDPEDLGVTGKWTDTPNVLQTTTSISSSTNASPIEITCAGHSLVTGDVVFITGHNTNLAANGHWKITYVSGTKFTLDGSTGSGVGANTGTFIKFNPHTVTMSGAKTATIDRGQLAWTAQNSSVITQSTTYVKHGRYAQQIAKTTPVANTKYAYKTITSTDYSSYQNISLWLNNSAAIVANSWKICLCSDTVGSVIVDTFTIPATTGTGKPRCLNIPKDGGGNLGSNIQSIALYSSSTTPATNTLTISTVIATTTGGLNLTSLISKSSTAKDSDEGFYPIQSISQDGLVIALDNHPATYAGAVNTQFGNGYVGISETVQLYKRETIKTTVPASVTTGVHIPSEAGTATDYISYEGGFDSATNIQNGETFFDGQQEWGYGLFVASIYYNRFNYLNFSRYNYGVYLSAANGAIIDNLNNVTANNNGIYIDNTTGMTVVTIRNILNNNAPIYIYRSKINSFGVINNIVGNYGNGFHLNDASGNTFDEITRVANHYGQNIYIQSSFNNYFKKITSIDRGYQFGLIFDTYSANNIVNITESNYNTSGVRFVNGANNNIVNGVTTTSNRNGGIHSEGTCNNNYVNDCQINESTKFIVDGSSIYYKDIAVYCNKWDKTNGLSYIYTDDGNIQGVSGATYGHTASGTCWKLSPTNARRSILNPLKLKIAKIAVTANNLVTVKAWFKVTNTTDIKGMLYCRGGQIAGVDSDISTLTTNATTNYEELTMTFTPTESGVVEIEARAYWLANTADESVFVDDMTITQA